jgi:hypothetical protein
VAGSARRTIVPAMAGLALALHLLLAAPSPPPPGLVPPLDAGPFQGRELAAASAGILAGDALVLGAGYGALELFANHSIRPTAGNFRTFAYGLGAVALIVPPLTAALLARLVQAEPAAGSTWKAVLLAFAGQVAALGVGYLAYPHLWVIVPTQIVAISLGASAGLHWGALGHAAGAPDVRREPKDPSPAGASARLRICPDPALAVAATAS